MIQQLGNVNKLCNCLLWSKREAHRAGPSPGRAVPAGCPLHLPPHWGRAGCTYRLTGVTFGFCSTHAVGPGLMALCRELQLSKQECFALF